MNEMIIAVAMICQSGHTAGFGDDIRMIKNKECAAKMYRCLDAKDRQFKSYYIELAECLETKIGDK